MSENFESKKALVEVITEQAKNASGIYIMDYKGITVENDTALRASFRKDGVTYKVYKNRLMKKAFENLGIKFDESVFEGPSAVAFATSDSIAPARIVADKQADLKDFSMKAAFVEGKYYDKDTVKVLSKIPAKEVLLTQLVGMLQMPIRKLAVAVKAVADKNN